MLTDKGAGCLLSHCGVIGSPRRFVRWSFRRVELRHRIESADAQANLNCVSLLCAGVFCRIDACYVGSRDVGIARKIAARHAVTLFVSC